MPRLFLGNFDFEMQLAGGDQRNLPSSVSRLLAGLVCCWVAVAEDGDFVWCEEHIDPAALEGMHAQGLPLIRPVGHRSQIPAGLTLVPWGWTPAVIRRGESLGAVVDAPPTDVVRQLNSRQFSWTLEQDLGVGLPGSAMVRTLDELQTHVERLTCQHRDSVVKSEYGNAGREQFQQRNEQPQTIDRLLAWAQRRLTSGQCLFVEPWIERLAEVGIQMTVHAGAEPRLEGVTSLICDPAGQYRGSDFTPGSEYDPVWKSAIDTALHAAHCARDAGYFGPLGIDAMKYRDSAGEVHVRPLQDINARWTMGRLSLGFRRLLQPGEQGVWYQDAAGDDISRVHSADARATRIIRTSPEVIAGRPGEYRSCVVITGRH